MKTLRVLMSTAIFTIAFCVTVMAGTWKSDANGWWFDEGNGSFPKNTWSWIDGNNDGVSECYYFDQNGYCLINTITPDNYYVNINGAWTVDGTTQTKSTGTTVAHSSGNNVDVVTEKLTIGEKKNKKKSKSKSKSSKINEDVDDEDVDDTDDNKEKAKKSTKNSNNLFDMNLESGEQPRSVPDRTILRGETWDDGVYYFTSHSCPVSYSEYYLGRKYKKLSIKCTPYTNSYNFADSARVKITIYNSESDEVLCTKTISHNTKIESLVADVTDVNYVIVECEFVGNACLTMGNVLMKDAILTK